MKSFQLFSGKSFLFFFCGCLLLSGCSSKVSNGDDDKSQPSVSETKKTWINPDTINSFVELEKMIPVKVNDNVTRRMAYLNDLMICIVDFENGPMAKPDPFHSHKAEQVTYVAEGEVLVMIGDKKQHLKAGDVFIVPSNVPHTVQSLTPKLRLVDTFNPIREDFLQK